MFKCDRDYFEMYYSHTQARAKLPKKRRRVVNTSAISEARKNRRNRSESKKMSLTKLGIVSRHGESCTLIAHWASRWHKFKSDIY